MAESAGFNAAPEARAARAARFDASTAETRYRKLEAKRTEERRKLEEAGAINSGQTELQDAVDFRGTCQTKCSQFEAAFREFTGEINPLEKDANGRLDPGRMVAAYTRSDAGAGLGAAAKLPSDLRTPRALVNSLDYLIDELLLTQPPSTIPSLASDRRALGYVSGFIRDRTRAIRKEFSLQTSWGSLESVECHEKIARYHILALRELQEETGGSSDMHNDSAELGRCFTSLRQLYEDLAEDYELPNRAEMQAYMLLFDLRDKFTAISASQLPSSVFNDPIVKIAFELRKAAQCNFDSQKEGSKDNAELGLNAIKRYIHLLRQPNVPFLLSCLAEIRLRELRRSTLRALRGVYLTVKDPIVVRDGTIVEKRMMKVEELVEILGCEEQEEEPSAFDDIRPMTRDQVSEVKSIVESLGFTFVVKDGQPLGALINRGADYKDNNDAPYTRRWASITGKRQGITFVDIVKGEAGVRPTGSNGSLPIKAPRKVSAAVPTTSFTFSKPSLPAAQPTSFSFGVTTKPVAQPQSTASLFPTLSTAVKPAEPSPSGPSFSFQPIASKPDVGQKSTQPVSTPSFSFNFGAPSTAPVQPVSQPVATPIPSFFAPPPAVVSAPEPTPSTSVEQSKPTSQVTVQPKAELVIPPVQAAPPNIPLAPKGPEYSAQELALSVPHIFSAICADVFSTIFDKDAWLYRGYVDDEIAERRAIAQAEAELLRQEREEEEEEERLLREEEERQERLEEIRINLLQRKYFGLWRDIAARQALFEAERLHLNQRVHRMGLGGNAWQVSMYRPPSPVHDDLNIIETVPEMERTPSPEMDRHIRPNGHREENVPEAFATALGVFEDHISPLPLQPRRMIVSPKRKRDWECEEEEEREEEAKESSRAKLMRLERALKAATRLITT